MSKITIDATALEFSHFMIPGQTDFIEADTVAELDLPPGGYNYQIGSALYCDFTFSVDEAGLVDYDPAYANFLSGAGTDTLRLVGFEVTLDARYLPGLGVIWCGDIPSTGWIQLRTTRLLPASRYRVQQGSGVVCDFSFAVDGEGRFQFDADLEVAAGGPLRGSGTTTLELLGFPILVDARATGGSGLQVHPLAWGVPFATTGVVLVNALPAPNFRIQLESGVVTGAGFDLDRAGAVTVHDSPPLLVEQDTFSGTRRVTIRTVAAPTA